MADSRGRSGTVDSFTVDNSAKREDSKPVATPLAVDQLRALLSPSEAELFDLLNFVRLNPAKFASRIEEEYLPHMGEDKILRLPGAKAVVKTNEGKAAIEEAIASLREISDGPELQPIQIAQGLLYATQDHLADQWSDQNGFTGHNGSDGSNSKTRANRYGEWKDSIGESLCYGERDTFRIVCKWMIDDGIPNRTNRTNIMTPNSKYVGLSMGAHRGQGNAIIVVICQTYTNDPEKLASARPPKAEKEYKSAVKRGFYSKNKTTTKVKTTTTTYDPDKKNCILM